MQQPPAFHEIPDPRLTGRDVWWSSGHRMWSSHLFTYDLRPFPKIQCSICWPCCTGTPSSRYVLRRLRPLGIPTRRWKSMLCALQAHPRQALAALHSNTPHARANAFIISQKKTLVRKAGWMFGVLKKRMYVYFDMPKQPIPWSRRDGFQAAPGPYAPGMPVCGHSARLFFLNRIWM